MNYKTITFQNGNLEVIQCTTVGEWLRKLGHVCIKGNHATKIMGTNYVLM